MQAGAGLDATAQAQAAVDPRHRIGLHAILLGLKRLGITRDSTGTIKPGMVYAKGCVYLGWKAAIA